MHEPHESSCGRQTRTDPGLRRGAGNSAMSGMVLPGFAGVAVAGDVRVVVGERSAGVCPSRPRQGVPRLTGSVSGPRTASCSPACRPSSQTRPRPRSLQAPTRSTTRTAAASSGASTSTPYVARLARSVLTRGFTPQECAKYLADATAPPWQPDVAQAPRLGALPNAAAMSSLTWISMSGTSALPA
jgi:hypothetical protein